MYSVKLVLTDLMLNERHSLKMFINIRIVLIKKNSDLQGQTAYVLNQTQNVTSHFFQNTAENYAKFEVCVALIQEV